MSAGAVELPAVFAAGSPATADVGSNKKPQSAAALFQCGEARLRLGDLRGAYEDFREAARVEPTNMQIWQKYEETYRAVEREIADEHAAISASGARGVVIAGSGQAVAQRRQSRSPSHEMCSGPPPRFSLKASSDSESSEDSDGIGAGLDQKGMPAQMQESSRSMAFGGATPSASSPSGRPWHAQDHRGSRRTVAPRPGAASTVSMMQATGPEARDIPMLNEALVGHVVVENEAGGARSSRTGSTRVEFAITNRRTFLATQLAWFITACAVVYYYRSASSVAITTMESVCILAFVIASIVGIYRCSRRKVLLSCSLTDVFKVLCLIIIVVLTTYQYFGREVNARKTTT